MVIVVSGLVIIIVGLISAFSVNFWMYATCRAVIGFFIPGSIVQLFIFAAEYFTTEYRPVSGLLLGASFTVGLVMLGVKAYFIRKWKILIIVCSAPYAIISAIFYK